MATRMFVGMRPELNKCLTDPHACGISGRSIVDTSVSLALDVLTLDAEVQPRETMSKALIQEYAELYRDGHPLAPIMVFQEGQTIGSRTASTG
jgi:hypothetical protein